MTRMKNLKKKYYYKIIFFLFKKKLIKYAIKNGLDWDGDFFIHNCKKYFLNIATNTLFECY